MNRLRVFVLTVAIGTTGVALAQIGGSAPRAATPPAAVPPTAQIVQGISARQDLIGEAVLNDQQQVIGKVDDLVLTPDALLYAVVSVGRFVGVPGHDVVVPIEQLQTNDDDLVLPGATREALVAMPTFRLADTGMRR